MLADYWDLGLKNDCNEWNKRNEPTQLDSRWMDWKIKVESASVGRFLCGFNGTLKDFYENNSSSSSLSVLVNLHIQRSGHPEQSRLHLIQWLGADHSKQLGFRLNENISAPHLTASGLAPFTLSLPDQLQPPREFPCSSPLNFASNQNSASNQSFSFIVLQHFN